MIENIRDYQVHKYDTDNIGRYGDKFITRVAEENGWDCWGKLEWTHHWVCYLKSGDKSRVYGRGVILYKDDEAYYEMSEDQYNRELHIADNMEKYGLQTDRDIFIYDTAIKEAYELTKDKKLKSLLKCQEKTK